MQATSTITADRIDDLVTRLVRESEAEGGYTGSAKAARLCGSRNPCTFSRHCTKGIWTSDGRRVVMESIVVGGKRLTTRAAVARFLAAQQPSQSTAPAIQPLPRTPSARRRASEAASVKADALLA